MLRVACVLKSGGIYTADWVYRLYYEVSRHLSQEFRFCCLSDVPLTGIDRIPLEHDYQGWWSKIELFDQFREGRTLYLDLDVLVTGDLFRLFRKTPGMTMCRDFLWPDKLNSSVMAWQGDHSFLHDIFAESPKGYMRRCNGRGGNIGDQAYIEAVMASLAQPVDTFDESAVVSYRKSAKDGAPAGASVVAFHGTPKPNKAPGWVRAYMEEHHGF